MLTPQRRGPIERPPSRIAGLIYIFIGAFALCLSAFVLLAQGYFGAITPFRTGFGIVIALYGLFRVFTGIFTIKRAGGMKGVFTLTGKGNIPPPKGPVH